VWPSSSDEQHRLRGARAGGSHPPTPREATALLERARRLDASLAARAGAGDADARALLADLRRRVAAFAHADEVHTHAHRAEALAWMLRALQSMSQRLPFRKEARGTEHAAIARAFLQAGVPVPPPSLEWNEMHGPAFRETAERRARAHAGLVAVVARGQRTWVWQPTTTST